MLADVEVGKVEQKEGREGGVGIGEGGGMKVNEE